MYLSGRCHQLNCLEDTLFDQTDHRTLEPDVLRGHQCLVWINPVLGYLQTSLDSVNLDSAISVD